MEKYTIDELLDVLQWARDRAAYYRACNKQMPGALYAADCEAERGAESELYRRGYYIVTAISSRLSLHAMTSLRGTTYLASCPIWALRPF